MTTASLTQFIADHTAGRLIRTLVSRAGLDGPPGPRSGGVVPDGGAGGAGGGVGGDSAGDWTAGAGLGGFQWISETLGTSAQRGEPDREEAERSECDGLSLADGACDRSGQLAGGTWSVDGRSCGGPSTCAGPSPSGTVRHSPAVRPLSGVTELTSETFRPVALNNTEVSAPSPLHAPLLHCPGGPPGQWGLFVREGNSCDHLRFLHRMNWVESMSWR